MVSKSSISRKRPLILVSIGSTDFKFLRVTKCLEKIDSHKYKVIGDFMPPDELIKLIKKADMIITHAGPGTLYLIAQHSRVMPLIIPRLSVLKEHVDDHQLYFAKYIQKQMQINVRKFFIYDVDPLLKINKYLIEDKKVNYLHKLFMYPSRNKIISYINKKINSL